MFSAIDPIITSLVGVGALGTLAGAGVLPIVTGHVDNIAETIETKRRRDAGKPSKFQVVGILSQILEKLVGKTLSL